MRSQPHDFIMKNFNRMISAAFILGMGAFVFTGCAARGGMNAKRAEAVLESKQNTTVKGVITLEETRGGMIAFGKLNGIRADRDYKVQIHEKGDCSARNASSAGKPVASMKGMADKKGSVNGEFESLDKMSLTQSSVVGKSLVVVSVDSASGKEHRVACGVLKGKAYAGDSCGMDGCKCKGADCKCSSKADCGCGKKKGGSAAPRRGNSPTTY